MEWENSTWIKIRSVIITNLDRLRKLLEYLAREKERKPLWEVWELRPKGKKTPLESLGTVTKLIDKINIAIFHAGHLSIEFYSTDEM